MKVRQVKKRDGRIVDFDAMLICKAITKAMTECDCEHQQKAYEMALQISEQIDNECPTVEDIQDLVEAALMHSDMQDVARAYILYRDKRNKARHSTSDRVITDIIAAKKNDITRENANMNADTPAGMMMKIASERSKEYVDEYLLSEPVRKAVKDNILHIHDQDYYPSKSLTCVQSPVDKILTNGFRAGHGESRAAKRIETASVMACISLESTQNEQHGGQAIPAFDFYMAPYVRKTFIEEIKKIESLYNTELSSLYHIPIKDYVVKELANDMEGYERYVQHAINMTVDRVHQAMEAFIHNMNQIHCVDGDELVWVHDTYDNRFKALRIREIVDSFRKNRYKVLSVNKEGRTEWKYIYDASFQGKKATYTVKGKGGRQVHVTDNHRIATSPQYGQLRFAYPHEIANIIVPKFDIPALYEVGDQWDLSKYHSRKKQNYTLSYVPLSYELCELLGYYVADGCMIGEGTMAFSVCDEEINLRLIHLMKKVYGAGVTWNITKYGKPKKVSQIRFNVGKVWGLNVLDVCGHGAQNKKVPYFVLGGTDLMQRSFLRGYLLCDGSIKTGDGYFNASSISKALIDGLDFMFLQRGEYQYLHERHMRDFYDKTKLGNLSYEISFAGNSNQRMKLGLDVYSKKEYRKYNKELSNSNYFVEDIATVETDKLLTDVYDIAVEDNENFVTASNVVIHNSRGGNQVVFSSINYGTDTSAEGRCIIRELLKSTYKGVGNGSTAIFPIQIWKKKRGVNYVPGDPNYDLYQQACMVTAKRFFPNFINLDTPFNQHEKWNPKDPQRFVYEAATMGCRTRVFENRHGEKTSIARGNLSFSTINLPGLALSVMHLPQEQRIRDFFDKLDGALEITAKQLYERYQFQCTAMAKQFPLLMSGVWMGSENLKPEEEVREVLKHGTLGIGFIGLAECLVALIGKHHGESEDAQDLGLTIIGHMKECAEAFSEKYDLNFSVLATPAEGLSGKFTKKDKAKYGIIPGVTDRDYYTNSNHVPVYYKCSAAHKARIEAPYHPLTRGGHIFYVELDGDATHNVQAVMDVVGLMDKYNIGYGSINHNRNRCLDCSYEDATKDLKVCPKCGGTRIDRLQRITGYLVGTTDRWNSGKRAELEDRVTHE